MEISEQTRPAISVVIPAFNEESRILVTLVDAMTVFRHRCAGQWEVIVVDDGSSDRTVAVVKEFAAECPELVLISHEKNQGKGAAVRTGVLASRGDVILFADADNATPFEEFDKLHDALLQGAAIACASRFGSEPGQVHRKFLRRLVASLFSAFARWTVRPGVSDTQCGFKLFRHDTARVLFQQSRESGYLFDLEILALASLQRLLVTEVPVRWREVPGSGVRILQDSWKMFRGLFRIRRQMRQRLVLLSSTQPLPDTAELVEQYPHGIRLQGVSGPLPVAADRTPSISAGAAH